MKEIGILLLIGGICLGIYAMNMDTTVRTRYQDGNALGLPTRVNNIGLMQDKQTYSIGGVALALFGVILLANVKTNPKVEQGENDAKTQIVNFVPDTKKCPQCAEIVKLEAKICRFCRYTFDDSQNIKA